MIYFLVNEELSGNNLPDIPINKDADHFFNDQHLYLKTSCVGKVLLYLCLVITDLVDGFHN